MALRLIPSRYQLTETLCPACWGSQDRVNTPPRMAHKIFEYIFLTQGMTERYTPIDLLRRRGLKSMKRESGKADLYRK
jgi:hypothetical protein